MGQRGTLSHSTQRLLICCFLYHLSDVRNKILKGALFNTNSVEISNDQAMKKNEAVILASVSNNNYSKAMFNLYSVESCNDHATKNE